MAATGLTYTSWRDIFKLICCPPLPSSIASKLAFMPPPCSYDLIRGSNNDYVIGFKDETTWQYPARELQNMEAFYTTTKRGTRIPCIYMRCCQNVKYTILYSHGNAVDLGQMCSFLFGLGQHLNCNVFSYDYSGYGVSTGTPSEANIYADIEAAWTALRTRFGINPLNIIIYGQSIGTVPTVDLASQYELAGVVLHSPLVSGMRVACPQSQRAWCFDPFRNIAKVARIQAHVLVIHGTDDEVIDFEHGLEIYRNCPYTVEPLWVEGAGHNDVELFEQFTDRLRKFVEELPNLHANTNSARDESQDTEDSVVRNPNYGSGDAPYAN